MSDSGFDLNMTTSTELNGEYQLQLNTLPVEVLVQIFSYLRTRQDLIACTRVSRSFYAAAVNPSLWKSLCHKVWKITDNGDESWISIYKKMFMDFGRYERCYSEIREAWDLIENYLKENCPNILAGLQEGASEDELQDSETRFLHGNYIAFVGYYGCETFSNCIVLWIIFNFLGKSLPNDYRCFLRIHNGEKLKSCGILGETTISNHFKQEAILDVNSSAQGYSSMVSGLRGCIPITFCTEKNCGHFMAITEEAGHEQGRVFWPSLENENATLVGNMMHCFVMANSFTQWFTSHAYNMVKEKYPIVNGKIHPYKFASQHTSDNGITVRTATCFLPELSCINPPRFFFTYRITISMDANYSKVRL